MLRHSLALAQDVLADRTPLDAALKIGEELQRVPKATRRQPKNVPSKVHLKTGRKDVMPSRTSRSRHMKSVPATHAGCYHRCVSTAELVSALTAAGIPAPVAQRVLEGAAPVLRAVERSGTKLDSDLLWVLIAVQADRLRRNGQ